MKTDGFDEYRPADAWEALRRLLAAQPFAVLATQNEGAPYTSLVCFAETDDLKWILFPTRSGTRKFTNLEACPHVALLMDNRSNQPNDYRDAVAVTAIGVAEFDHGGEAEQRLTRLRAKHPALAAFLAEPDCRMAAVRVSEYRLVTQFEKVTRLDPARVSLGPDHPARS